MMGLLTPPERQLLNHWRLCPRLSATVRFSGPLPNTQAGRGMEFVDYRDYQAGDDWRRIDWSVFRRWQRLVIKRRVDEDPMAVEILIDNSRSMHFGQPDKLLSAKRLALALAQVSLQAGHRVRLSSWQDSWQPLLPAQTSQTALPEIERRLSQLEPVSIVDYKTGLHQWGHHSPRQATLIYLSDLLYADWSAGLMALGQSGAAGYLIQILAPTEEFPPQMGEVNLVDSETEAELALHLDSRVFDLYHQELNRFREDVWKTTASMHWGYSQISSQTHLNQILQHDLGPGGLVC